MKKTLKFFFIVIFTFCALSIIRPGNAGVDNKGNDQQPISDSNDEEEIKTNQSVREFQPFIMTRNLESSSPHCNLPVAFSHDSGTLRLIGENPHTSEVPLCPEIRNMTPDWKNALSALYNNIPPIAECLFLPPPQESKRLMCTEEPQASLMEFKNYPFTPKFCGENEHQRMVYSGYNYCGKYAYNTPKTNDQSMNAVVIVGGQNSTGFKPQFYKMYQICYDFKQKRTLWTKHKVKTPALLAYKHYPYNSLNTLKLKEFKMEKSNLNVNETIFIKLKKAYESAKNDMNIYTMVPKSHMALPYWKKATTHFINSAPLLPEFTSLMEAIHNGIFLASYYFQAGFNETLQIYTKADTMFSLLLNLAAKLSLTDVMKRVVPNVFQQNTWYMFVHNKSNSSGVLIVLHNFRKANTGKRKCDVREQLPCNFRKWSNKPDLITEDNLRFAYCCPVSQEMIKKLYAMENIRINKDLNLQEAINSAKRMMKDDQ